MSGNNDGTMVVTYASLDLAAGAIDRQSKQLQEDLAAIKRMIANVSELWVGEAKSAYDTAQKGWDDDATAIHNALSEISRKVREAGGSYHAGDKRARANFE
ncbi:WXG100 family type VII secretion target [Streptomyces sp. NBC_00053]|uniref:WXG100 family type VII secretion target n=1 Tax=unclassified Streptomyces TaxID=2593676 RepID=UPI000F5C20B1|nr:MULTISPECIES: WXG100 family type VII secretion target [unclassified Streptomyces]WSG53777.1 WXG100 family type VII secretion target [Streptomyces sp. NBC_01732]WSX04413.1 WXG100 family type VII secretion target [Streptomyces sp. NBC_00987]MCX5105453.1 WXG100 family type VII secretion target [Streptomyces sp. NBC_00439]MCX5163400.1 WXG100 family type VII secretion target [Streptomyces sp. NBC_00305]MCX5221924.1 WXG100 family type VII secretion target [Streptomyces sp. NBC_00264]